MAGCPHQRRRGGASRLCPDAPGQRLGRVAALAQLALGEQGGADVPLGQRVGEGQPAQLLQPGHERGRALVEDVVPGGDHLGEAVLGEEGLDGGLVNALGAGDGGLVETECEPLRDAQGGAVAVGVAALPADGGEARAQHRVLRLVGAQGRARGACGCGGDHGDNIDESPQKGKQEVAGVEVGVRPT